MNKPAITLAATVATISLCSPTLGMAARPSAALESCAKAFMTSLPSMKSGTFKLIETRYMDDAREQYSALMLGNSSELELTARDAHDNHALARVTCTVNSRGEVLNLRPEPLQDMEPYSDSSFAN